MSSERARTESLFFCKVIGLKGSRKIKFTFLGLTISCLQSVFAHKILKIALLLLPVLLNDLGVVFNRGGFVHSDRLNIWHI